MAKSKDCPYSCTDGRIFVPAERKWKPCPYCSEKAKEIARGKEVDDKGRTINEILNIPAYYQDIEYDFDKCYRKHESIVESSIQKMKTVLDGLLNLVVLGEKPKFSCYINLGLGNDCYSFIYPFLVTAYKNNLKVSPLVSDIDIYQLINEYTGIYNEETKSIVSRVGCNYEDLITADICCVTIDSGATYNSILALMSLLQARARSSNATLVFTNNINMTYRSKLLADDNKKYLHLLTPYEILYNSQVQVDGENLDTQKSSDTHTGVSTMKKDIENKVDNTMHTLTQADLFRLSQGNNNLV